MSVLGKRSSHSNLRVCSYFFYGFIVQKQTDRARLVDTVSFDFVSPTTFHPPVVWIGTVEYTEDLQQNFQSKIKSSPEMNM